MVSPGSRKVPRASRYSGTPRQRALVSLTYRAVTFYGWLSMPASAISFGPLYVRPTTPRQPKLSWFRLFPVRSPLLWESQLISLPQGTKMFQLPWFALPPSPKGRTYRVIDLRLLGFPIRMSPDQCSVSSSPRLIAAIPRPSSPLNAKASPVCS